MLKALLRVQLAAFFSFLNGSSQARRRKSAGGKAGYALLMLVAFGSFAVIFYELFSAIAAPFAALGLGYFYFAIFILVDFCLMLLGTVFTAKAQLFEAKDNDALLSLPLPPQAILFSRICLLLMLNFFFELLSAVPAAICWYSAAPANGTGVLAFVLTCLLLPLTATAVSALLAWLISLATRRIRNKSMLTTVFSLAFLALYFVFYSKAMTGVAQIAQNGAAYAEKIRGIQPLYVMGSAVAEGNLLYLLESVLGMLLPFLACWFLLSATFLRTVSTHHGFARVRYRETAEKPASAFAALYRRELRHLLSSSGYIMNGALGVFGMVAAAVALCIKWDSVRAGIAAMGQGGAMLCALLTLGLCFLSTMTTLSASSVSLEGKTLWIVRSLPVDTREVLRAKLWLHLSLALPSTLLPILAVLLLLRPSLLDALLLLALPLLFNWFLALLGLAANLKLPNFDWLNETAAVKNGIPVLIVIFGGWLFCGIPIALFFLQSALTAQMILALFGALLLLLCLLLRRWIGTGGAARFRAM